MIDKLVTLFRRSAVSFLIITLLLVLGSFLIPAALRRAEGLQTALYHQAHVHALALEREIIAFRERVESLTSRTMIREALRDYLDGAISADQAFAFIAPRFADGAMVYDDLQGAARYTADGDLVTYYGALLPPAAHGLLQTDGPPWPEALPQPDVPLQRADITAYRGRQYNLHVRIAVPIVDNGRLLGQDVAIFQLPDALASPRPELTLDIETGQLQEAVSYTENGRRGFRIPIGDTGLVLNASYPRAAATAAVTDIDAGVLAFVVLSVAFILLAWYVTLYQNVRRLFDTLVEQELRLSQAARQNELLVRETNHRVKNNLSMVMGMIDLQLATDGREPSRTMLSELKERIRSVVTIHDMLHSGQDLENIELLAYLERLSRKTVAGMAQAEVRLAVTGNEVQLPADECVAAGLIVNELCTNALKYGVGAGGTLTINIELEWGDREGPARLPRVRISVMNDGPPLPRGIDPHTSEGFGLRMVRALTEQLGGSLEFDREPQTVFHIVFPLCRAKARRCRSRRSRHGARSALCATGVTRAAAHLR